MSKELDYIQRQIDIVKQQVKGSKVKFIVTDTVTKHQYDYYERELQTLENIEKSLNALQLVKAKSKKNYNLALVVDSGTYEQYCEQFKYFLDDYKEKAGAFEIWEEDKFSFEEYNLLREVFVYE